jgi:four helix bundle protein
VDTQVQIAHRLGYLKQDVFGGLVAQVSEVGRILNGLIASLMDRR